MKIFLILFLLYSCDGGKNGTANDNTIVSNDNAIINNVEVVTNLSASYIYFPDTNKWSVTVKWEPAVLPEGASLDRYTLFHGSESGVYGSPGTTIAATEHKYTIDNIASGTSHYFQVITTLIVNDAEQNIRSKEYFIKVPDDAFTEKPSDFNIIKAEAGNGESSLTWGPSERASSYIIQRGISVDSFPVVVVKLPASSEKKYTEKGLENNTTYYYTVIAVNSVGNTQAKNTVFVKPKGAPPSAFAVNAAAGDALVSLNWTSQSLGAENYSIQYWSADPNTITTVSGTLPNPTSVQNIFNLTNGTTYHFTVIAHNSYGDTALDVGTVTPVPTSITPGIFELTTIAGDAKVTLEWVSQSEGADTYSVEYWSSDPNTSTLVPGTLANPTSISEIPSLTNGLAYTFKVTATNSTSGLTRALIVGPVIPGTPPGPFVITVTAGNYQATVNWTSQAQGAVDYVVKYWMSSIPNVITTVPSSPLDNSTESYIVTGLNNGTDYTFEVIARNIYGNTSSNDVNALPGPLPGSLSAMAIATNGKITLDWSTNPSQYADTYTIQYWETSTPNIKTTVPSTPLASSVVSYDVTSLTNGTSYTFKVIAHNSYGDTPSSTVEATPVMPSPGSLTLSSPSSGTQNNSVSLSWTPSENATAYRIYYKLSTDSNYTLTSPDYDLSESTVQFQVEALNYGETYNFKIKASNSSGEVYSNEVSFLNAKWVDTKIISCYACNVQSYAIAKDSSNNIYVASHEIYNYYNSPYVTQGIMGPFMGTADIVIKKYDFYGVQIGQFQIGSTNVGRVYVEDIVVDNSSNIYITGITYVDSGTSTFNGEQINVTGNGGGFIAKLDSSGQFLWSKLFGQDSLLRPKKLSLDASGNLYVAGWSYPHGNGWSTDTYIEKYNSDIPNYSTNVQAAFTQFIQDPITPEVNEYVSGILVDNNDVYISGALSNYPSTGSFVDKFNTATGITTRLIEIQGMSNRSPLARDADGNIFLAGTISAPISEIPDTPMIGTQDLAIFKFDPNGAKIWGKTSGTALKQSDVLALTLTNDSVVLGGYVNDNPWVGRGALFQLLKTNGSEVQTKILDELRWFEGVVSDSFSNVYFTGYLTNASSLDGVSVSPSPYYGDTIGFVSKYNSQLIRQ